MTTTTATGRTVATSGAVRNGAMLMAAAAAGFIGYAGLFLVRSFTNSFLELGIGPKEVDVSKDQIQQFSPASTTTSATCTSPSPGSPLPPGWPCCWPSTVSVPGRSGPGSPPPPPQCSPWRSRYPPTTPGTSTPSATSGSSTWPRWCSRPVRGLREETAASSLGEVLGAGSCDEDDLYAAMDWLAARQDRIQDALAARHLAGGTLVLYDVSSAAFEGRTCPLGAIGHPKDGVRGRLQIVYGLLTSKDGVPVAIEVFEGNTGDPKTVASQVGKVKNRFGISRVVLVGDRGMLTAARLREDVGPAGLDWITALRAPQVKALVRDGALQLSLFDQADLAEITHPDYPGERLVACKNPFLEAERARKRESLLHATEADLAKIAAAVQRERRPLRGQGKIALRADRVLRRRKVAKHFTIAITDTSFSYHRDQDSITGEAALDGIYVLRTTVTDGDLNSGEVVASYKSLAQVERAFRAFNTDLDIRPIRHHTEERVRAHVFLRMLSYYITWHMHDRLAPLLFTDDDKPAAQATRRSPVAPAARSPRALAKAAAKRTPGDLPVHSFHTLLADLATICLNQIQPADPALPAFRLVTTPTPLQRQALDLLGVSHRLGTA